MTSEQTVFIQILRDHLAGTETEIKTNINWKTILYYARIHQVEEIVFYQCKKFLPTEIGFFLEKKSNATLFYYKNRERDLCEIGKAFDGTGIQYFTVKGMSCAAFYPIPPLRTMGDIDIVVHREDKKTAGEVLEALGYSCKEKAPDYDWSYFRNRTHVELHHQLFYLEPGRNRTQRKLAGFFNHCWDYVDNGNLDWSFHFLFILAHLRKHMMNSGVGFRMFMDIAAIINNDSGLDWCWIEEQLELLKMDKFSGVCFALCEKWFGVQAPLQYDNLDELFFEEATEKVFTNGIFGFDDKRNINNVSVNSILKNGRARWFSRVQMLLRYMFPRYMHMRYIEDYSFIEGRPWLLPIAWLYRFIRLISGKTERLSDFVMKVNLPDTEVDIREEELRRWGLRE